MVLTNISGLTGGLLSKFVFHGRVIRLTVFIAVLALVFEMFSFVITFWFETPTFNVIRVFISLVSTLILHSLAIYGLTFELAKIELLSNKRRIFAMIYTIYFACEQLATSLVFTPLVVAFFPLSEWNFRITAHVLCMFYLLVAIIPLMSYGY